jgi:D-alanyl-D-alanine carboxypeptidase (penicillin-binding protein 5/6)
MRFFERMLMRRVFAPLLLLFALPLPAREHLLPAAPAPAIAAKSYLLRDLTSGQILLEHEAHQRTEPASLTKLMTAYLTFSALRQGAIRPDQRVDVSVRAWRTMGSRMFIEPGKPVTVEELMNGMIVQSGNDAAVALAELIGGSEEAFAQMMNREAKRLGMKNTNFVNATGLPHPQHYSTAYDIALVAAAIIRDFPDYYRLYSQKEYRYNNITQANRNRLLWTDPTVDGMKTGHTENAGYCLVTSAKRGERRLLSVVLGAASASQRASESQKLINYGFRAFDTLRLYGARQPVATLPVFKGLEREVRAGFLADLYVTLPKGQEEKLKASVESVQPLVAPVAAGQTVGALKLTLDGKPFREFPVVALENVPLAGVLRRTWDSLRLLLR